MNAVTALLLFAAWTLVLMLLYVLPRVLATLTLKKAANSWPRGTESQEAPFIKRAHDAHLNCVENLPVFAAIVLSAAALGKLEAVNLAAAIVFHLRLAQSVTHLVSTNALAVFIRANFFLLQVAGMGFMIWKLTA